MAAFIDNEKASSIQHLIEKIRVSSVLNRDVKQFGKQNLIDGDEESCWNSDKGENQSIIIKFKNDVMISEICMKFQGGFSAKLATIDVCDENDTHSTQEAHLSDSSELQKVAFVKKVKAGGNLKITLTNCTDTFGRVTMYTLDIRGSAL